MENKFTEGFSRLSKDEKIRFVAGLIHDPGFPQEIKAYWHPEKQELFDSFSENTITNFYLPFGIAPNFLINGKIRHVPMVVEESSVVAAAASAAKFWAERGGFHSRVVSTLKKGHVHFLWFGKRDIPETIFPAIRERLISDTAPLTFQMQQRGGGIRQMELEDFSGFLDGYFRLSVDFETIDSMGANFMNSVLEQMAVSLRKLISEIYPEQTDDLEIIMSILSNHAPQCLAECMVSCPLEQLDKIDGNTTPEIFVQKFKAAADIAAIDIFRAATHNKGIMNGVDAVVIATGNDFRAVEAGAHAYAAREGRYKALSFVETTGGRFTFTLRLPLTVGTVGGLTRLHPVAGRALQILGNPDSRELMSIIAAVGLASNFSAIRSLVTRGIQQGHMKMHLSNMLLQYHLDPDQQAFIQDYFRNREISFAAVRDFISQHFPGNV